MNKYWQKQSGNNLEIQSTIQNAAKTQITVTLCDHILRNLFSDEKGTYRALKAQILSPENRVIEKLSANFRKTPHLPLP